MSMRDLVSAVVTECAASGVTFKLHREDHILHEGNKISGFFAEESDDGNPELAVAGGRSEWLLILAHEYSHMCQWKEGMFDQVSFSEDVWEVWEDWLAGNKEYNPEAVEVATRSLQYVEFDAEQRTVDLLRKYDVRTGLRKYTQRANSYILSYEVMRRHRKWTNKARPYDLAEIVDLMPTTFVTDFTEMPKGFEKLVVNKCFN